MTPDLPALAGRPARADASADAARAPRVTASALPSICPACGATIRAGQTVYMLGNVSYCLLTEAMLADIGA